MRKQRTYPSSRPNLSLILLFILLAVLWIAGGASRADVLGQVLVRGAAWAVLVIASLFGSRPALAGVKPVVLLLAAAMALALLQLVPLPPNLWQAMPGREIFLEAATASNQPQPWRSWAIVPGAALNAASSLIVPIAIIVLIAGFEERDKAWLPGIVLGLIAASTLIGLLQFTAGGLNNPFINDTPGEVSGTFANRNHFALFLAFGCLLAPVWAFFEGRHPRWRAPVAFGLVLLFVLTILASGSRAGILLGVLGLGLGLLLTWQGIRRALSRYPTWVFPALIVGIVSLIVVAVVIAVVAGRAVSIDRVLALDQGQDMRSRSLPTIWTMINVYFPMGSGLGGFDPIFRIHEPLALLKVTYFNHAHNDLLEVVLDAGVAGLLLLCSGLGWWAWASVRAWRAGAGVRFAVPKLGSAMLLLILIASGFDYPARTPLMMAMMMIAAVWLDGARHERRSLTLPMNNQHL